MKNISTLEPTDKNAIAIRNVIKIRNWVKQNIPEDIIDELYSNGAHGQFETNGYYYRWGLSKTLGITMTVGCSTLVSYNNPSRGSGCGEYPLKDDEQFYYGYDHEHYGAFVDHWPRIRETILSIYNRVKARREFEP